MQQGAEGLATAMTKDSMSGVQESAAIAEAYFLAETGQYHDYTDIEYVLRFEYGLSDVCTLLDHQPTRLAINQRCAEARERLQNANLDHAIRVPAPTAQCRT